MEGHDLRTLPWSVSADGFPADGSDDDRAAFLVRYAILAPSSHNTQPWRFRVDAGGVDVRADLDRWLCVADDDQRELHVSLGCAVENLVCAATHFGYQPMVDALPSASDTTLVARVTLGERGQSTNDPDPAFEAIAHRRTNHRAYRADPLPDDFLAAVAAVGDGTTLAVVVRTDDGTRASMERLSLAGDAANFGDAAYRTELAGWLSEGVFGTGWLMSHLESFAAAHLAATGRSVAKKDASRIAGSPAISLIATAVDDRASQLAAGRAFQRIALLADAAGIGVQPESQALEDPGLRAQVAAQMAPQGWVAQHLFRMGFGPEEPHHTPRRPVESVVAA